MFDLSLSKNSELKKLAISKRKQIYTAIEIKSSRTELSCTHYAHEV